MEVPNHTQIPNVIIDRYMKELSLAQFKVLIAICRKTIGWHKQSDYISISQIVEISGVTAKTAVNALKDLERMDFIVTQKKQRSTTHITLNYDVTMVASNTTMVASNTVAMVASTHTKETLNKYKKGKFIPTIDEVVTYFSDNGYSRESAEKMYNFYQASISNDRQKYWKDSRGNPVKNWKQKAQSVWFKPENKTKDQDSWSSQGFTSVDVL